jgi:hypothetical protein
VEANRPETGLAEPGFDCTKESGEIALLRPQLCRHEGCPLDLADPDVPVGMQELTKPLGSHRVKELEDDRLAESFRRHLTRIAVGNVSALDAAASFGDLE